MDTGKRSLIPAILLGALGVALAGCVAEPYAGEGSYAGYPPDPGYYGDPLAYSYPPAFYGGLEFYDAPWARDRGHDEVLHRAWEERAHERALAQHGERPTGAAERSGSSRPAPPHGFLDRAGPDRQ